MLVYVMQGIGYGFAAAVQPGPFQTYITAQTLSSGWRNTLPAALAPLISDGPIIALVLLVLIRYRSGCSGSCTSLVGFISSTWQ